MQRDAFREQLEEERKELAKTDKRKTFQNIKKQNVEESRSIEMTPTSDTRKSLLMQVNSFKRRQRTGSGSASPAVAKQVAAAMAQSPSLATPPTLTLPPDQPVKRNKKLIVFRKHVIKVVKIVENQRKSKKKLPKKSDSSTPASIAGMISPKGDCVEPLALDTLIGISEQLASLIKLLQERKESSCSQTTNDDDLHSLSTKNLATRLSNDRPPKGGNTVRTTPSRDSETSETSRADIHRATPPSVIGKLVILRKSSSKSNYCSVGSDDESEGGV